MPREAKGKSAGFDRFYIRQYMALSAEEKFKYLHRLNEFVKAVMPKSSKKASEILRKKGW